MSSERASKRRKLSPPEEEQRARASTRQSGSRKAKKQKSTVKTTKSEVRNGGNGDKQDDLPSVKGLDSSDSSIRRKTLTAIISHLDTRSSKHPLTKTECLQLWRGFHVIVYMHDSKNAISVQNLLREIAGTFATIARKDDELAESTNHDKGQQSSQWLEPYHTAFHETIIREWAGIDSHRMNKYLLLIRFVMQQLFRICFAPLYSLDKEQAKSMNKADRNNQGGSVVTEGVEATKSKSTLILDTLRTVGPLNPKDPKIPNGLRLHILDIWVDELFGTLSTLQSETEGQVEENDAAVGLAIALFRQPLAKVVESDGGAQKNVRVRAKEAIADFDEKVATLMKTKGSSE